MSFPFVLFDTFSLSVSLIKTFKSASLLLILSTTLAGVEISLVVQRFLSQVLLQLEVCIYTFV